MNHCLRLQYRVMTPTAPAVSAAVRTAARAPRQVNRVQKRSDTCDAYGDKDMFSAVIARAFGS